MKKSKIDPKELIKDTDKLFKILDDIDNLDIDSLNISNLENDIKEMAEVSGGHRGYEFIEPFTQTKIGVSNERQRG